jgi:hypothetical protein
MKLLLENWREFISENEESAEPFTTPHPPEWIEHFGKKMVKGSFNITDHTVGHLSKGKFTKFDDSRTGSHTAGDASGVGEGKYNLDSYFGPMFSNDKDNLLHPDHVKSLGGKYMLTVKINGKFAKMSINDLRGYFPQILEDGTDVSSAMSKSVKDFKQWLIDQGYDGIWWHSPGLANKSGLSALTSNALSVFSAAKNAEIVAIRNLATKKAEWKK